jgi:hypothetical protein
MAAAASSDGVSIRVGFEFGGQPKAGALGRRGHAVRGPPTWRPTPEGFEFGGQPNAGAPGRRGHAVRGTQTWLSTQGRGFLRSVCDRLRKAPPYMARYFDHNDYREPPTYCTTTKKGYALRCSYCSTVKGVI